MDCSLTLCPRLDRPSGQQEGSVGSSEDCQWRGEAQAKSYLEPTSVIIAEVGITEVELAHGSMLRFITLSLHSLI